MVRVKPVKTPQDTATTQAENAVHFYRQQIDVQPSPTGSFLGAFIHHSGVDGFFCQSQHAADYEDFVSRVTRADTMGRECTRVGLGDVEKFRDAPVLRIRGGDPSPLLWRRRTIGQRAYSIAAEFGEIGAAVTHEILTGLMVAPAQPWDALIFPSKTLKLTAEALMARQAEYLLSRSGTAISYPGLRYVIPPGINANAYASTPQTEGDRVAVRRRLGIQEDDLCVLMTGNFSFYARAHPTPLYLALEAATRRTGIRIHLLQAGWFENEQMERAYRDAVRDFAPGVNAVFLDGREPEVRDRVWYAADVYAAFHDTISHGLDSELLEAMAAGLPVIATDWGSNRDIVKNGQHGFVVPTWLPLPESGGDLSLAPENILDRSDLSRADTFLAGTVNQTAALDVRAAADAFQLLANDPERRAIMGDAARKHVMDQYDWSVIVRRHQALWAELRRVRETAGEIAPPTKGQPAVPHMDDPYSVFSPFASHAIDERTVVMRAPGMSSGEGVFQRLERLRSNAMNDVSASYLLEPDEQMHLLDNLSEHDGIPVSQIAELVAEQRRFRLPRTLGWLAKLGIVLLSAHDEDMNEDDDEAVSPNDLGIAARQQGADDVAYAHFGEALARNPQDPVANLHLGELYAQTHDLDAAIDHFERAAIANPAGVDVRMDLGKALILRGDTDQGVGELQKAVELSPENDEALYLLGVAYRRVGSAGNAIKYFERSLRLNSKRAAALVHLAYARKSAGRRAEALQSFRDALRLEPMNMRAHAGEMSLGVERGGKRLLDQDSRTRRIAIFFGRPREFHAFSDLFVALSELHWPLISGDADEIKDFEPDVVLVADMQGGKLREHFPNAIIVVCPGVLASMNRFPWMFKGADAVAAPGVLVADNWGREGYFPSEQIFPVGYLGLERLFRGDVIAPPSSLLESRSCVLYAPGAHPHMSSASMIAEAPIRYLRGDRDDVTVVIKPHPDMFVQQSEWLRQWRKAAIDHDNVVLVDNPDADILPYLKSADVLVTDASSVMFDFLAVDRPILLLRNPNYTVDPVAYDPKGIEWRWREIGREVVRPADLPKAVDLALKTPDAGNEVRERYAAALFDDTRDGAVALRIIELISELST